MKSTLKIQSYLLLATIIVFFTQCKKSADPINIQLYDKPLSTIQQYITGKWKLEYTIGGFTGGTLVDVNDTYMILDSTHIIIKDKSGIRIDTSIIWQKIPYGSATTYTYLMNYSSRNNPITFIYAVQRVEDGMLVLRDVNEII